MLDQGLMNQVIIFVLGALAGAIIQRYADRVLGWLESQVFIRRTRSRSAALMAKESGKNFSFCGIRSSIFVAAFDPRGIDEKNIVATLQSESEWSHGDTEVDDAYKELWIASKQHWQDMLESRKIFNGTKFGLKHYHQFRDGMNEASGLNLSFAQTDYLTQRTRTGVYQKLPANVRKSVLERQANDVHPFFSNSFGVSLAVITLDGDMVFAERSHQTAVNAGKIACGVVEGMDERDVDRADGKPNPYVTAHRGLAEELGVNLNPGENRAISLHSLVLDTDYYEWSMLGVADFRKVRNEKVTSGYVRELWASAKGRDKYELGTLVLVRFTPQDIGKFIVENADRFVNYALVATIYALLREFPRHQVAAAFGNGFSAYVGFPINGDVVD